MFHMYLYIDHSQTTEIQPPPPPPPQKKKKTKKKKKN